RAAAVEAASEVGVRHARGDADALRAAQPRRFIHQLAALAWSRSWADVNDRRPARTGDLPEICPQPSKTPAAVGLCDLCRVPNTRTVHRRIHAGAVLLLPGAADHAILLCRISHGSWRTSDADSPRAG